MPIYALICVAGVAGLPTTDTNQSLVPGVDQVRSPARRSGPRLLSEPQRARRRRRSTQITEAANNVTSATDRKLTSATMPTHHANGTLLPERMTYGISFGGVSVSSSGVSVSGGGVTVGVGTDGASVEVEGLGKVSTDDMSPEAIKEEFERLKDQLLESIAGSVCNQKLLPAGDHPGIDLAPLCQGIKTLVLAFVNGEFFTEAFHETLWANVGSLFDQWYTMIKDSGEGMWAGGGHHRRHFLPGQL